MKKQLVASLAAAMVLGVAGSAFAAANPFVDVPAKHWSYDSVTKLAQAGIVDGYSDGKFQGDKTMTRYEMAQIVAKAMGKSDKADAAMKAEITKLEAEYADELNKIGVRVEALEKKASSIKITGDARIRYGHNFNLDGKSTGANDISRFQMRARLSMTAPINDNWTFNGRMGAQGTTNRNAWSGTSNGSATGEWNFDKAEFAYKNGDLNGAIGRQYLTIGQGLIYDAGAFDGASIGIKKDKFAIKGYIGDVSQTGKIWANVGSDYKAVTQDVNMIDASYAFDKNFTLTSSYLKNISAAYNYKIMAVGAAATFGDFKFQVETLKNDNSNLASTAQKKGTWAMVTYKNADMNKVGSYDFNVHYSNLGAQSVDGALTTLNVMNNTYGVKGFGVGGNYVFAKNAQAFFWLEKVSPYDKNVVGHNFDFNTAYTLGLLYKF